MSKIKSEINKLSLLAEFATATVHKKGTELVRDSKIYQPLLKTIHISTSNESDVSWVTCKRLDKVIDDSLIYISLVEWSDPSVSQEFDWYELKADLDVCDSIIKLKRKFRDMIKNPEKYVSISYS